MELAAEQLIYIGVVASVITQGLRLIAKRYGYKPSRLVVNVGLFVLSIGMAVAFFGLPVVGGDDPFVLSQAVLQAALAVVGSAGLIYNIFLDKVLVPA
jgi:hypothetical protein